MTDPRLARLQERMAAIDAAGLRRRLRCLAPTGPVEGRLDGRPVVIFCSNDALGLAQHPEVKAAWRGAGSGSARLISGNRPEHLALEEDLSRRYGRPATLLSSGWHANLAALTTLIEPGWRVSSDAANHASLIDGLRLSRCDRQILPHLSLELPEALDLHVTEGLFSMDGDRPDAVALRAACDARGAWLLVDEAHAVGAVGPEGRGAFADAGVEADVLVGTLGKAYGAFGAFVVGPPALRALLLSAGRSFIFTTGLPEPACAAARVGLALADDGRRARLAENAAHMRRVLHGLGLSAPGRDSILPLRLGPKTLPVAEALLGRGFYVAGIRAPTVPSGTERLRIALSAAHSAEQIEAFGQALRSTLSEVAPEAFGTGGA